MQYGTNPFLTRSNVVQSSSNSFWENNDNSSTLYQSISRKHRMTSSQARVSEKQMEKRVLFKYQKQLYSFDEEGKIPAEVSIENQLMTSLAAQKKEDFWDKVMFENRCRKEISSAHKFKKEQQFDSVTTISNFTEIQSVKKKVDQNNQRRRIRQTFHEVKKIIIQNNKREQANNNKKKDQVCFSLVSLILSKKMIDSQLMKTQQLNVKKEQDRNNIKQVPIYPSTITHKNKIFQKIQIN